MLTDWPATDARQRAPPHPEHERRAVTVLHERAKLLAQAIHELPGRQIQLRIYVAHCLRRCVRARVRADVRREARAVRRAPQRPLVRDVIDRLVLVPGSSERARGRLEGDGVRVLRHFCREPAARDRPRRLRLRERDSGDGRVVREERDVGRGVDVLEVLDLHADDALCGRMHADAEHGSCGRVVSGRISRSAMGGAYRLGYRRGGGSVWWRPGGCSRCHLPSPVRPAGRKTA